MTLKKEYLRQAEAAKATGAHVAVVMYYCSAVEALGAECAQAYYTCGGCYSEGQTALEAVLDQAAAYASELKKPTDQTAVLEWALHTAHVQIGEGELVTRIQTALAERGEQNGATP